MKPSATLIFLIKSIEKLRLKAYLCQAGKLTIGYGHTGNDVHDGLVITLPRAEELLAADLAPFCDGVSRLVRVPLSQDEFDALVCFVYNIGLGAFKDSTLLRKLNSGDKTGAAQEFPRWRFANGNESPGLTKRREIEQALFRGNNSLWKEKLKYFTG